MLPLGWDAGMKHKRRPMFQKERGRHRVAPSPSVLAPGGLHERHEPDRRSLDAAAKAAPVPRNARHARAQQQE
jgi:hypothetical protein